MIDINEIIKPTMVAVVVATYAIFGSFTLRRFKDGKIEKQEELFRTLTKGFISGAVENIEDIINVFKGVYKLTDDIDFRSELIKDLRRYLVKLIQENTEIKDHVKIISIRSKIDTYITKIETQEPFVSLPVSEKNILIDTLALIKSGNKDLSEKKLKEIAGLIEARQDLVQKLEKSNKWSVPIAIIGVILTVIFGIASIIVPFIK